MKFTPVTPRENGRRGDSVIKAHQESALSKMLEVGDYVDDRRRGNDTCALDRMERLKVEAESLGNVFATQVADEAIQYLENVLSEIAQIAYDFAQVERKTKQQVREE